MKKLTTQIIEDNKLKTIHVWLDDTTASLLNDCDERIRHEYIVAEYKDNLINRAETRRHVSLDQIMDNGMNFADYFALPLEDIVDSKDTSSEIQTILSTLSPDQKYLLFEVFIKGKKQSELAQEMGIAKSSLNDRITRIRKKFEQFLN